MTDYKILLEGYGFARVQARGDEINADCVLCGDRSRKFYLNARKGVAICFKGCFVGSIVSLVAMLEGCSIRDAKDKVSAGGDWVLRVQSVFASRERANPRRVPFEMPHIRGLNRTEINYLIGRGIDIDLARTHGVAGCDDHVGMVAAFKDCARDEAERVLQVLPKQFDYLKGRIVWPMFRGNKLVGAEARAIAGAYRKTLYPENVNLKRSLFVSRTVPWGDYIVVVEGILDALSVESWHFPVGATMSAGVSHEQAAMLLRFARVYCAYDADKGGEKGLASLMKRTAGGTEVLRVILPEGKDPNDCDPYEFIDAFAEARRVPIKSAPMGRR